jgi:hypothetical protein
MIPRIPLITETVRPLNERMWSLLAKEREGTISAMEQLEVNLMFLSMEAEQDNWGEMK